MPGFKVIIIGGGLSGALLANGLLNNGVEFSLYERDSEDSKREGYQIRLGASALKGFHACLKESQIATIRSKFGQSADAELTAPVLMTTRFTTVVDLSKLPSYAKSSAINRVVLRDMLTQPIKDAKLAQYGRAFQRYEIIPMHGDTEKVKVHFDDGSYDVCDILVGADGSSSRVNRQLGVKNLAQITSHWSFLVKGNLPYDRIRELPKQLQKTPVMVFANGASLFYALYLPPGGKPGPNPDISTFYDEKEASFFWGLHIPVNQVPYHSISEIPDRLQLCKNYVQKWASQYYKMVSVGAEDKDAGYVYAYQMRVSKKPKADWRRTAQKQDSLGSGHPRVWLMGDAMHAMQPNRGMGGNQALHDCADMLPYLLAFNAQSKTGREPTTTEIQVSCDKYERVMIKRAFAWVQKSGGDSVPNIDFDGLLGSALKVAACILLPILGLFLRFVQIFNKKE